MILSGFGDPGDFRFGYLFPGFPDYWCASGTRPHQQVPGVTGAGKVGLRLILLLNPGELKVKEGTHGTKPMGLQGGQVGSEKHTNNFLEMHSAY